MMLPRLDLAHVANPLERGEPGDGHDRRLLEAEGRRLGREMVLASTGVLGQGAVAPAEHLVTGPEPGHPCADRLDAPGDVHAQNGTLGLPSPSDGTTRRIM